MIRQKKIHLLQRGPQQMLGILKIKAFVFKTLKHLGVSAIAASHLFSIEVGRSTFPSGYFAKRSITGP